MLISKITSAIVTTVLYSTIGFSQITGSIQQKMDAVLTDAAAKDVFAGSVLLIKDDQSLYEKSIGLADEEKKIGNTAGTKYPIGSITKLFTKTIILQLTAEKKIQLNDKIVTYLPGFTDPAAAQITIDQLTEHTSGLGDYASSGAWDEMSESIHSISELLAVIQKSKLLFAPGTKVEYSNSGYAVLAALIEKKTAKPLGDVYKERIFDPLKMNNSGFSYVNKAEPGKAVGYLTNFLGPKRNNLFFKMMGAGDGGIYSTTHDLWQFAHSIMSDNKLLSDDNKLKLFNSPLFPVHYADWNECKAKGRLSVAGGAPGISAVLGMNLEKHYCFVVLSNYDERSSEPIAQRISAVMNDKPVLPIPLPPARVIYSLIKEKGPQNFIDHYKKDLDEAGVKLEDDMILLSVGQTLLEEKNADEAIALYTVYTKEFPNIIIAWNDMGDAYLLKGDKVNAKKCFEQALKLRPGNQRAQRALKELSPS
jgi:CubicO group peptidase (beta-lactamase class C family)